MHTRPFFFGLFGGFALLAVYFSVLTTISGWTFAWVQFDDTWAWIIALSAGFGVQIALYTHIRNTQHAALGRVVTVSGTTSTVAMISCCAHYAVQILPFLGATGIATLAGMYQTELFILGIFSNLAGIVYLLHKGGIVRLQYAQTH